MTEPAGQPGQLAEPGEGQPGLARERTDLAWTRTAISFAAIGAAMLKSRPVAGIPVLLIAAVVWRIGGLRWPTTEARNAARRVRLTLVVVTAVALAALVITLLGTGSAGLRL